MKAKYKRYTLTLDTYIYARNDNEAKVVSAKLAESTGSDGMVLKLEETPYACLKSRLVHEGGLTLFENHIINA